MIETQTQIRTVFIEDLPLLPITNSYSHFRIIRSTDPMCIYKWLDMPNNRFLIATVKSNGSWVNRKTLAEISIDSYERGYTSTSIYVIARSTSTQTPKKSDNYYSHEIQFGNDVKMRINYQEGGTLVKENGNFYFSYHNCNFPVNWFESTGYYRGRDEEKLTKVNRAYAILKNFPVKFTKEEDINDYFKLNLSIEDFKIENAKGITKVLNVIKPFYEEIVKENFNRSLAFKFFADACGKTVESVQVSTLFNRVFAEVDTQEKFDEKMKFLTECFNTQEYNGYIVKILEKMPEGRDIKKAAIKRKSSGAFNKIMDDLDFIDIDKEKYPLTHEAVHGGELPLGTFFRKTGESYFVYNDNWSLWESMLKLHPEVAKKIAAAASGRTTYEKDLMSYFYFTLFKLPAYLEKYTGEKWTGVPKLVNSSNELDPPKEGETGTVKTRSALTPIVDNENHIVTVPYVSMQISGGYGTTYCYGLDYNVLLEGFSWNGNVITEEVEKLNGRDNYGLMFYTLTGTAQGRGYPTFLIIFEDLTSDDEFAEKKVRVHFHRTHPFRSKNGEYNPVHGWIRGCYKWMIGNVNYERIKAQQGDLAFVQIEEFPKGEITTVNSYDSHCFEHPTEFTPYVKKDKQNVLGYIKLENETKLNHTEHRTRKIPAGNYEIRQCRSWEANPKGIWSLRID